ncbi:unnamed protein product, partial [Durusdinium trenchii]
DLVGFVKASKPLRGDHETRAVHLKVFMDKLHLREPLEGVHVVAKLSPEQEVLARPVTDEGGMGRIGLTAVAEEPAWRLDELKQVVFGPWPEKLFFELWRGDELLGLAACPVPLVDAAGPWTRSAAWCGRVFRRKGMGMEGGSETGHCKDRHRWSKQVPSPDHPYM